MQVADRIIALERRAGAINLSLWRVCKLAQADYSNISRWKRGLCSPTERVAEDTLATVESKVKELEEAVLAKLVQRPASADPTRQSV